jgi:hypothetical protein
MITLKRIFFVTIIIPAIVIFSNVTIAQNKPAVPKPEPRVQRIAGLNVGFVVALIHDCLGGAWIGTEDDGTFHYQVDGKVSQFTTKMVSEIIMVTLWLSINSDDLFNKPALILTNQ